jgi:hypothetical protein
MPCREGQGCSALSLPERWLGEQLHEAGRQLLGSEGRWQRSNGLTILLRRVRQVGYHRQPRAEAVGDRSGAPDVGASA